jgi:phage baseplate assembly protein V
MVVSPSGDPSQGSIIGSLYQDKYAAKADSASVTSMHFSDGTSLQYDKESHKLSIETTADGSLSISVTGKGENKYTSDFSIDSGGDVSIKGSSITIEAESISFKATSIKTNVPIRTSSS